MSLIWEGNADAEMPQDQVIIHQDSDCGDVQETAENKLFTRHNDFTTIIVEKDDTGGITVRISPIDDLHEKVGENMRLHFNSPSQIEALMKFFRMASNMFQVTK